MVRRYRFWLILCTALTLFLMVPGMSLLLALFTFGLAGPLLIALPMLCLLLWALLPAVWVQNWTRWPLLVGGLGVVAAVVLLPPVIADRMAARLVSEKGQVAPQPLQITAPIGVEVRRQVAPSPDFYAPPAGSSFYGRTTICIDLCEQLLAGGDVAWIRMILTDDAFANDRAQTRALLIAARGAACTDANPDLPPDLPCILFAVDHGLPADLTLVLEDDRIWKSRRTAGWPMQEVGYRTASAYAGPTSDSPLVYRAVQLFHERPTGLFATNVGFFDDTQAGGLIAYRKRSATAAIDLAGAIQALSLSLGPERPDLPKAPGTERNSIIQPPPDAQDAAYVASLLATGQEGTLVFSNAFAQVINGWHDALRWKSKMTDADREIFCRSTKDNRILHFSWADQVQKKQGITCP